MAPVEATTYHAAYCFDVLLERLGGKKRAASGDGVGGSAQAFPRGQGGGEREAQSYLGAFSWYASLCVLWMSLVVEN